MSAEDYLNINKKNWNERVETHITSSFYDLESFVAGKSSLNEIELSLLPPLKNKSLLHLQCHFGQDSISLARTGAKVCGLDFSEQAINKARELAGICGAQAEFICCDVYSAPQHLNKKFDVVFTSYGTIGWLPDIKKWAQVVATCLKPGGKFVFAEFHPVVWMFDNDLKEVEYSYFKSDPIIETESGTYADRGDGKTYSSISWNHGMGEVIGALLECGLTLETIREYDYSPHNCFRHMVEAEAGKFRIRHLQNKIPMVYSLRAIKK